MFCPRGMRSSVFFLGEMPRVRQILPQEIHHTTAERCMGIFLVIIATCLSSRRWDGQEPIPSARCRLAAGDGGGPGAPASLLRGLGPG